MIRTLQNAGPTLKIILGALLVLICASMVTYLIPSSGNGISWRLGGPGAGVLATIGEEKVTVAEVQREAHQMVQQQGASAQASMLMPFFAQQAAQQLINQKAIVAEARSMGLRVDDNEVVDELQHGQYGATFFPDGKFVGQQMYEQMLQGANLTVPQFEALVKEGILAEKLRAMVSGGAFVSDAEVREEFERRNTKVKFEYAVITDADIMKGLHPTAEELKAFYDHNKATYSNSIPEKRQIKYALVDTAKIAAATPVSEQDLQAYYDQHRGEFRQDEEVKVQQIQFNLPLNSSGTAVDEKGVAAVRQKADDVLKQLKAGVDFAKLAQQYSEDSGSKNKGGDLGWLRRGQATGEFGKAVFSLAKGQTSDLVNSGFAFHIIRVEDKQEAHVKLLAEVKNEIQEKVKQQKAAQASEAAANSLLSAARAPDGFDKAASAKGQTPITTELFSRNDTLPGLGPSPQLMDAVFNEADKAPPDLVQVPQGYVVFELLAVHPSATPTFEQIHDRVESEFKNQRAGLLLRQKTQELSDRAKAEHDLKKVAKDLGASVKTSDLVGPDGQVPDVGSMAGSASAIFALKPGEISGPINTGANGVVAQLLEKQPPSDQDFAAKKDQIRQGLLDARRNELFQLFVFNLRKSLEKSNSLKINQEEMKRLTKAGSEEGL